MRIRARLKAVHIVIFTLLSSESIATHNENIIDNGTFENRYYPWEPPGWCIRDQFYY